MANDKDNLENEEILNIDEVETPADQQQAEQEIIEEQPLSDLEKAQQDLAESKDKYIRLYSEFENYRRRTAKEKIDTVINATEGLIKDLLPILDDFERAQKSMETSEDIQAVKEGITLIYNKIHKTLASKGLKAMESKDTTFDVELHECITQFDAGQDKKGLIVDEVEKGYYLNEKVIRYAKVVVGS